MRTDRTRAVISNLIGVLTVVGCCWVGHHCQAAPPKASGLRVPPGFEATLFADDDLAHNIYSMTIDSQGRVVVAGPGYVKTLHDDDQDGRADRATLYSPVPKSGAHGMCFDGPDLVCTGDNSVMRLRDTNGDGKADGEPEIWTKLRHPEHGANGIIRGPDGWFYLICGNDAGVSEKHAMTKRSPVLKPQCGAVVRFSPNGKISEVFAHGFRNPYDIAFDARGHLFTFEADGERDQYLPWYAPCRVFDIAQGMHHGWVLHGWKRSWNRPQSYFDNVERMIEVGRGSPTGVAVYRHTQFPKRYHNGLLFACWSLGKVYFAPLTRSGSTYKAKHEVFLETTGDVGFAPVDLAIGPAGDLFVVIGGRGTRGSVFRVRYVGDKNKEEQKAKADDLTAVLRAPQPLSSWSRAKWVPVAKKLGRKPFLEAMRDSKRATSERIRAIEVLIDVFEGAELEAGLAKIINDGNTELTARAAWATGRLKDPDGKHLMRSVRDKGPLVERFAWEALLTIPKTHGALQFSELRTTREPSSDRRAFAARVLAPRFSDLDIKEAYVAIQDDVYLAALGLNGKLSLRNFRWITAKYEGSRTVRDRLRSVRLAQLCLNDITAAPAKPEVHAGYLPNGTPTLTKVQRFDCHKMAELFPTGDDELDRELARLLGMVRWEDKRLLAKIVEKWTARSTVQDDVHYLIVMSLLEGKRDHRITRLTAAALCDLHHKMTAGKMYPSRNWPLRVGEAFAELMKHDPALAQAIVECGLFGHSEHVMFVQHLPLRLHETAVRKLLADAQEEEDPWPPELVPLVATLPQKEALPALRKQWDEPALRDAITHVLAKYALAEDRDKLVQALRSADASVVQKAAEALKKLEPSSGPDALAAPFEALRRHLMDKRHRSTRESLAALLHAWTKADIDVREPDKQEAIAAAYQPWFDWLAKKHPQLAATVLDAKATGDWSKRIEAIDFSKGDATRGKLVFVSRNCAACHTGRSRLGPDLVGVGGRFSHRDLLIAIIHPDRDVSPTYQATLIETAGGKTYHGVVVYDSPDATLVQTSATETLRIAGQEIVSIRRSRRSLMPTGLLDSVKDADVADMIAYLKTLK